MEYPTNIQEFDEAFGTEQSCRDYLFKLKYKKGFVCHNCGGKEYWVVNDNLYTCKKCRTQNHLTAGTIFQDTHKPLSMWFKAMWWITSQKNGTSALGLQRILGIGSYRTAWTWLHKLRVAMVRPNRDKLSGIVEVDECFIGGKQEGGQRGRGTEKTLVAIAVERNDDVIGRIRLSVIKDASAESLKEFVENSVKKRSTIITDGWRGYNELKSWGYRHKQTESKGKKDKMLPNAHLVISLLKRWIMGTMQGSVSDKHLSYYLDEYTFRFNRRTSANRGKLFYRLIEQSVELDATTYNDIIERETA